MSTGQAKAQQGKFGMIGLGVMGRNLALNVEEHGFPVTVWNLETDWTEKFVGENKDKNFIGSKTLQEFVEALERPRRIMMMIKAGDPVDLTIKAIKPFLERDDILIDGGNSWFKDTQRREAELRAEGLNFFGS
ncbi:MAG TPA: NAD(P)-binding domain-containing protein, partial [Blastocatellia bacterium]|nr:NAD(P)-binding domain-containing protein [Blastocatellia bacterium]